MQAGKRDVLRPIAQCAQRALHRRVTEHSIQSFANGGKNHAWTSGFHARGTSAFADLSEDGRGGVTRDYGNGNDAAASGFYFFAADDLIAGPVAAFYQHIRKQAGDEFLWRQIIENHDRVDAFQRSENFGTFAFRQERTPGAFQLADTGITVEANDERIPETASLLEAADVPGVQQIETAVGENDLAAVAFLAAKPQNRLLKSQNLRIQRDSMNARAKTALALDEKLVYHAPRGLCLGAGSLS
jgi:alkylhydroperoxidase family enzyme